MSLFKRPAWAKFQATEEADDAEPETNLFSHSSRSFREIVAEKERQKQAKDERKKARQERRTSEKREAEDDSKEAASSKRRRLSTEDDEVNLSNGQIAEPSEDVNEDVHEPSVDRLQIPQTSTRRSPRKNKQVAMLEHRPSPKQNSRTEVISLGESDSEDEVTITKAAPHVEAVEEESDDDFAELARRARISRQQKEQDAKTSHTPDAAAHSASPPLEATQTGNSNEQNALPDPTIELLITGERLEGTKPMIVYRKFTQNIAEVRKVWCKRQNFSPEMTSRVFFIHRMKRVYDVTTCRSLGLELDSLGNMFVKGFLGKEEVEKVHLEAVTEEIFQHMKAEKAQESQRRNFGVQATTGAEDDHEATEQPKKESLIRLVLKAKGRDDFKLKVKPSTTFSRIIAAYAKTNLERHQAAFLEFDGEKLTPEDEVQSTEVSDMDCIDVHITSS